MQDLIIKGTGNSRYLKSAIPEDITHQELVQLLRAGTFPIDLNGLVSTGIEQLGTPLNVSTLLKNSTITKLGFDGDDFANVTVNDALNELSTFASLRLNADEGVNIYSRSLGLDFPMPYIIYGTYVGTGGYGESSPTIINYGDDIDVKFISIAPTNSATYSLTANYGDKHAWTLNNQSLTSGRSVTLTWFSDRVQLVRDSTYVSPEAQLNGSGTTYSYVVIGSKKI